MGGILAISFIPDRFGDLHAGLAYLPIAMVSVAVIVGAVADDRPTLLTWAPVRQIGKSSYAIYLWHIPMFRITGAIAPGIDSRIRILVGTAIAVTISHWLIERPALRLKHRWS